ncbi:MAG: LPS-assembly protein LptD [Alphaproteobacteria bacterium]|nr:LPS-assembly protein LptD [Alphaproteobacteria bacterium]
MTRLSLPTAILLATMLGVAASAAADPEGLQGDILLRADEVDYDMDNNVVSARGHVEIDDQGRILLSDRVDYDQKNDIVTASGHVSLLDAKGNVAFADHVTLTDRMRNGALSGFSALIGKSGRLAASSARRVGGQFTVANHVVYTPCKICNQPGHRIPLWRIRAYKVIYDEQERKFNFSNASLEFFGVPILYSPFLTAPDPTVRYSTGILTPTFGNSTIIGYYANLPVYIAISDSSDATLAPLVSTKGGELLQGEYRQRWDAGGMWLQASFANNPSGGINQNQDQTYSHAFGSIRYPLSSAWRTGADLQYTSNDTYLLRYDISQMDRLMDDLFISGENGRSRLAVTGYYFEGLRAGDSADKFPFVLPLFQYSLIPEEKIAAGQVRLDINSAVIDRTTGPRSQRLTGEFRWRLPLVFGAGQLLSVIADARGDVYHVSNNDLFDFPDVPTKSRIISRGMPYLALDWRWPFVNDFSRGRALVVEPIAQVIAAPYGGNPAGIPDEDSASFETDENNLFSFDRVPGFDLLESGPRVNAGFRAQAIFPSGSIETEWGQTYRLKPDPIFASDSGERGTVSDIVGRLSVKFSPYIELTDRIDLDRVDGSIRRHEVYLTGTYGRSSLQLSYTQLPPELVSLGLGSREEINAQADVNFYANWQAFAAIRRDLIADKMLDSEFGLGYEDECLGISIAYRQRFITDRDLPPSTAVILRFNLKSGEKPIEPFSLFPRDVFAHP